MELMDRSLDQVYVLVYQKLRLRIPEDIVGKMAEAVRETTPTIPHQSFWLCCEELYTSLFHFE